MKTNKIIRYRLSVSRNFPAKHPRKGQQTYFKEKIELAIENERGSVLDIWTKLHTIRANFDLWQKRFEKIEKGEAVLELYYWSGKPYNSKCETICQLSKEDEIGLQCAVINDIDVSIAITTKNIIRWKHLQLKDVAKNDGLSDDDFNEWFKKHDISEPLAIIHFTKFRY